MMKYNYITIEREYGSGGSSIARILSEQTGIPCYGGEILEKVSQAQGIPVEQIERYEESVTNSFLYSIYAISRVHSGDVDVLTREGHIFVAEQAIIKELAEEGPAIFIGHCACEALKGKEGVAHVFIRASEKERIRRSVEEYGLPEKEAVSNMKRFDKKRANYFYANTLKKWDDYKNYDIILDSGTLGMDACVKVLKGLLS